MATMSRELCKICYHVNPVGFHVPDQMWRSAVPVLLHNVTICLQCFVRLADEKRIRWDDDIELFPVSLATHCDPAVPRDEYDPPLDPGIAKYVKALRAEGIETYESCQGGEGHSYPEPAVRFHGDRGEGFRALAIAQRHDFPVACIRRIWPVTDNEPTGPWWEMVFATRRRQDERTV